MKPLLLNNEQFDAQIFAEINSLSNSCNFESKEVAISFFTANLLQNNFSRVINCKLASCLASYLRICVLLPPVMVIGTAFRTITIWPCLGQSAWTKCDILHSKKMQLFYICYYIYSCYVAIKLN